MVEGNKIYPFTNDVIFKVVMQDESIAKGLISIILGRKVSKIKNYTTQKDKKFQKLTRGVRFDLYFEDSKTAYEVEMQNAPCIDMGRRCRFYQGMIDIDLLQEGQDFGLLKDSYIIFLCTYDPFGQERPTYIFESVCTNEPKGTPIERALKLDTGAKVVICNACAYNQTNKDMRDFLQYLATQKVAKGNPFITKIEEAVRFANADEEIRSKAMIQDYKIRDAALAARKEGLEQGLMQGQAEGLLQGLAQGQAEEQTRLAQIIERNTAGLSPEQQEIILKQFIIRE